MPWWRFYQNQRHSRYVPKYKPGKQPPGTHWNTHQIQAGNYVVNPSRGLGRVIFIEAANKHDCLNRAFRIGLHFGDGRWTKPQGDGDERPMIYTGEREAGHPLYAHFMSGIFFDATEFIEPVRKDLWELCRGQ